MIKKTYDLFAGFHKNFIGISSNLSYDWCDITEEWSPPSPLPGPSVMIMSGCDMVNVKGQQWITRDNVYVYGIRKKFRNRKYIWYYRDLLNVPHEYIMLLPRSGVIPRPGLVIRDPVLCHETRSKIFLSPFLGWRFSQHQVRCQLNFYGGFIASGMRICLKLFYVYKCFMIFS